MMVAACYKRVFPSLFKKMLSEGARTECSDVNMLPLSFGNNQLINRIGQENRQCLLVTRFDIVSTQCQSLPCTQKTPANSASTSQCLGCGR